MSYRALDSVNLEIQNEIQFYDDPRARPTMNADDRKERNIDQNPMMKKFSLSSSTQKSEMNSEQSTPFISQKPLNQRTISIDDIDQGTRMYCLFF